MPQQTPNRCVALPKVRTCAFSSQAAFYCGQQSRQLNVVRAVVRDVVCSVVGRHHQEPAQFRLAASARQSGIKPVANALLSSKDATGLRALGLNTASLLLNSPGATPGTAASARGTLPEPPQKHLTTPGWAASARPKAFRGLSGGASAPDHRPTSSLRDSVNSPVVRRASRSPQRITSRLGARSPFARWGVLMRSGTGTNPPGGGCMCLSPWRAHSRYSGALGTCAQFPPRGGSLFAKRPSRAWAASARPQTCASCGEAKGGCRLRALAVKTPLWQYHNVFVVTNSLKEKFINGPITCRGI